MTVIIRAVCALLGALGAAQAASETRFTHDFHPASYRYLVIALCLLGGAAVGWLVGVLLGMALVRALRRVETATSERSSSELFVGGIGLLLGLVAAALVAVPVSSLPYVGTYLLLPMFVAFGYVFTILAVRRARPLMRLLRLDPREGGERGERAERSGGRGAPAPQGRIVDTSAIIDGRLGDIVATGFLEGELVIPVFVLEELQRVADSADPQRRARGRRGLEVVQSLRKQPGRVSTPDVDYPDVPEVDAKLVRLARERGLPMITTDYNLNKVARIQSVTVLNVNELANALKPAVLPGEALRVKLIREGKEADQGVGYLDDGTMVVVEAGRALLGSTVDVEVTSVLQSPSGKMIFARTA
jgi:uncharacterized protein YacL